jgi:predicted hydrolase (HD superfamily)
MNKLEQIKQQIEKECKELKKAPDWFFDKHLLGVEKMARELLKKLPEANEEIVMLGVWLHDLERIRDIDGEHAKMGAIESEKVLKEYDYNKETIEAVKKIILTHSCDSDLMPESIEGKILASADALSHFINDFYINIAVLGQRNTEEFKKYALDKLNRDCNKKIQFDFAKEMIQERYDTIKKFITLG